MHTLISLALGVFLLLPGASAQAAAVQSWELYDNFQGTFIDPTKWLGKEISNNEGLMRDSVREIDGNRLHLKIAAYGDNNTVGGELYPSTRVIFRNALDITGILATIKIGKFGVEGCPVEPDNNNTAWTRIVAPLFNVNQGGPAPDSRVGDVIAQIRIQSRADAPETLKVYAKVQQCDDANCDNTIELFSKMLRTINKDQSVDYSINWNKAEKRIQFTAGRFLGKTASASYSYGGDDYPLASTAAIKGLQVQAVMSNCTDKPWPRVHMEAFFDNVRIKTSSTSGN